MQRVVRCRQETLVLGHRQEALLLRLTRVLLVLDGLMLRRIPAVILPVAIAHRHARRRGRHRRTLPRSPGQCSRIATTSTTANSRLTSATNHTGVMLLLMGRLLLLQTVILRRMRMVRTAATAGGRVHGQR